MNPTTNERRQLAVNGVEAAPKDVVGWTMTITTRDDEYRNRLVRGYGPGWGLLVLDCTDRTPDGPLFEYVNVNDLVRGELHDHLDPAPTMTVRVGNRGQSRSYEGVRVATVTLVATCPLCGGPRGEKRNNRIIEDGEYYSVHNWDNPCGHVDMYSYVLIEAGVHLPPHLRNAQNA